METLQSIEGERDIPNVSSLQHARWKRGILVLSFIGAVIMCMALVYARYGEPDDQATLQRDMRVASSIPERVFEFRKEPEPAPAEPVPAPAPAMPTPPAQYTSGSSKPAPRRYIDKSATGINVPPTVIPAVQGVPGVQDASNGESGAGLFGGESNNTLTGTATAAYSLENHSMTLTQGMVIQCSTDVRTVTSVPGIVVCRTTNDVYSATGEHVVIPKGSNLTGEYQTATRAGNRRIFIMMNRVRTPAGVVAMLESPAAGPLGASGIEGNVNHHFWQRFGGAMLLGIVDDVITASTRTDTTANVVIGGAANTGNELAAEVLRNTINIKPTVYAHHGQPISITVARDIDFSGVLSRGR